MDEKLKSKFKEYLSCVIAGVLFLVLLIVYSSIQSADRQELSAVTREKQSVQTKIDQIGATKESATKEANLEASGLDMARVQADDKVAKELFEKILTWSSYEEYETIRDYIANEYELDGESTLLSNLFPEIEVIEDQDGNTYNVFDMLQSSGEPLNLKFMDMSSYVTDIHGTDYSYFTEVFVSSSSRNGGMASGRCVFLYTVSEDGELSDLHAYTVAE